MRGARDGEIVLRPHTVRAGGNRPSLRQQQCASCRGKVSRMQLADALIASSGRDPPPAAEWVGGLRNASASRGRLGSSTDSADASPSLCRGRGAREWDIHLVAR